MAMDWKARHPRTAPKDGYHHVIVSRKRADGLRMEWVGELPSKEAEYLTHHTILLAQDKVVIPADQHPDDDAVDRFAAAMKARMAEMRAKGKSGWDDPAKCPVDYLERLLQASCVSEPVDIGNYAMMLFNRKLET